MKNGVNPIPEGYRGATPYLIIDGAAKALDFYKTAFGANEVMRFTDPSGRIGHADIQIGDAHIMLADEFPDFGYLGPKARGGSSVGIQLYVEDVDAFAEKAVAAGATLDRPVTDQFYGDRTCTLSDPFGHVWYIATRIEEVSLEELQRRSAELYGAQ